MCKKKGIEVFILLLIYHLGDGKLTMTRSLQQTVSLRHIFFFDWKTKRFVRNQKKHKYLEFIFPLGLYKILSYFSSIKKGFWVWNSVQAYKRVQCPSSAFSWKLNSQISKEQRSSMGPSQCVTTLPQIGWTMQKPSLIQPQVSYICW